MHVTIAPRGILQIDDARLVYRNFSGAGSKYNREGDRNFAIVIHDEETKDALMNEGYNIKIKPPRDVDDAPFMYLPVKIKFNDRGPIVYLSDKPKGGNKLQLDEESIGCLDMTDILTVDLDVRPYDWEVNGQTGRTAYLQSMHVVQRVDRFAARFAEEEYPEE